MSQPYTLWAGIIGGIALTLATHGTDQFLVQRLLSARSAREAARGLVLSGVLVFAQFVLFLLIGVMLFTYYQHVPLPRPLARADELLPVFIVTALTHGAAGFIVAAIVAAALSPSLNSMAATTVNDFYLKYQRPDADEQTLMRVSRIWTVVWGIVQIGVAVGAQWMQRSVLDAGLAVLSYASGSVLGAFLLGTLAPSITETAAFAGMLAGLVAMTIVWGWTTHRVHLVRVHRRCHHGDGGVAHPGDPRPCGLTAERWRRAAFDGARRVLERAIAARTFPAAAVDVGIDRRHAVAGRGRHADRRCRSAPAAHRHALRPGLAHQGSGDHDGRDAADGDGHVCGSTIASPRSSRIGVAPIARR